MPPGKLHKFHITEAQARAWAQAGKLPPEGVKTQTPAQKLLRRLERNKWVDSLRRQIDLAKLPAPVPGEHKFDESRQWRFDLAWPDLWLAIEVDGGVHRIKDRFERDLEKITAATLGHGWTVVRVSNRMVRDGTAIQVVRWALIVCSGPPIVRRCAPMPVA